MSLILGPNLQEPDTFYAALIGAHEHLTKEQSDAFNARLILLLANHIGDLQTLTQALEIAARPLARGPTS